MEDERTTKQRQRHQNDSFDAAHVLAELALNDEADLVERIHRGTR